MLNKKLVIGIFIVELILFAIVVSIPTKKTIIDEFVTSYDTEDENDNDNDNDNTNSDVNDNKIITTNSKDDMEFYVEKDGSGDFTSLVEAIKTVSELQNATLYVGEGTWDIVEEFGAEYMETVSAGNRGLYLKNGIHVICSSRSLIVAKYEGNNENTIEWFSAFNSGEGGFTLENAKIETDNIRYSIHDERDSDSDSYKNYYLNCSIKHTNGFYSQCIGGGLGVDGHIIIDGCLFITDKDDNTILVSYHNSGDGYWTNEDSIGAQSFLEIKGCYLDGTISVTNFGQSTESTDVLIHDNSLGADLIIDNEDVGVINYYEWNNVIRDK